MSNVIKPTVGRKVWYRPSRFDLTGPGAMAMMGNPDFNPQPLDATVLAVHGDRMVNVLVLDVYGKPFTKTSVRLLQDGDETPKTPDGSEAYGYVEWMPYQTKAAAREPALDALGAGLASMSHPLKAGIVPLTNDGVAISTPPAPMV